MSIRIETFAVGPMDNNLYLLIDEANRTVVVIDPSLESDPALERARILREQGYTLGGIWITHGHFDHVHNNARWKREFGAPIGAHPADTFFLEFLREQSIWFGMPVPEVVPADFVIAPDAPPSLGNISPQILHLPGHSPGSVGFYFPELRTIISGDVLFAGSTGRTDLPEASAAQLADSVRRLYILPAETRVLPGHGPATTIGREKVANAVAAELMAQRPAKH